MSRRAEVAGPASPGPARPACGHAEAPGVGLRLSEAAATGVQGRRARRVAESAGKVTVPGGWSERESAGRCVGEDSYLPGRGDTMITKVVFPGRGLSIALWVC